MASILDILGNAFKKHVQDTRTQIRVGNTLAAMGFKAKAVPTTTSAANTVPSQAMQSPMYIGAQPKSKLAPSFVPNAKLISATPEQELANKQSYNSYLTKPSAGSIGAIGQAVREDIYNREQVNSDSIERRLASASNDAERKAIVMGNVGIGSLFKRAAPVERVVSTVADFTEPLGNAVERVAKLAREDDSSTNTPFARGAAAAKATYEGAKVYGAAAKGANPLLKAVSRAKLFNSATQLLPEDTRQYAQPVVEMYSILTSPDKITAGLSVGAGRLTTPVSNYINEPGRFSDTTKDALNLILNIGEDAAAIAVGKKVGKYGSDSGKVIKSFAPAVGMARKAYKETGDLGKALDVIDAEMMKAGRVPESGDGKAEVLGYRKVADEGVVKPLKTVSKTTPIKEVPGYEALTTPDEIAAAARASKKMFPKGVKDPIDISRLKDLNLGAASFNNLYANTKKVFGDQFSKVSPLLDEFDIAKGKDAVNFVKMHQDAIQSEVVNRGIKKGSKADADIQRYGEGKITLQALQQKYPTGKRGPSWEDIVHADDFFRTSYAEILPKINAVVAQIYPGQADKLVLPRKDYYRHFQEMPKTGIGQAIQALSSPGGNIPSELTGISAFTTPKTKYASIKQKRTTDKTTYSAIGGFDNYLPQAAHAIYIDPFIPKFRALGRKLVELTGDDTPNPRKVNSYIEFLEDFSNDLAGKTNPYDRPLLKFASAMNPEKGRAILKATVAINSQVKANSVLGNIGSSISQLANIPYGVAEAGVKNTLKGYTSALSSILTKDHPASQSAFMNERFAKTRGRFDRGVLSNAKRAAMFITGVGDEVGTRAIWSSLYEKAKSIGEVDPVRYADVYTRKVVGGRGVGEMSIFMNSKTGGIVAPFQIEVANLWNNVGKDIGEKQFSKLLTYSVAAFAFNQAKKQIYGGNATLDPIDAGIDAVNTAAEEFQDGNYAGGVVKGVGRVIGEAVKNAPLGQTLASMYPQYGSDDLFGTGVSLPPRNEFLGEGDPTRFGTGFPLQQILKDPYNLLPFGGQQVKRTVQGVGDFFKGRHDDASGNKQYEVSQTLGNLVRGALLGPRYFSEAKEYNEGPKLDIFGNPEETFLSKVFNPNSKATELNNPILKEIERVGADKIDVPSASIMNSKLTKDEFIKYQSSQGEVLREFLQKAIDSPAYKAADDIKKRDMLEMVAQESENIADQVVAPPLLRKRYNVPESMSDSTMKKTFSEIRKIRGFSDLSKADQEDTFIQIFSQYPGTQK
jgi:hypothetical protein